MNLKSHYQTMYNDAVEAIHKGQYELDTQIHDPLDTRSGLTLLLRPSSAIKDNIEDVLRKFETVEPHQYYYPKSDMHITVMSIISCHPDFELHRLSITDYRALIQECLTTMKPFKIHFKGLTASRSCIMVQGFLEDEALNDLRDKLRTAFKQSNLEQSLDKRYNLQTAHATIIRFQKPFQHPQKFLQLLEAHKHVDFGSLEVQQLELVHNDWYQKKEKVTKLVQFALNP